ncbi:MAG: Unknown protein [uncultured Sulfurovum sp.]|uniref:Uncharacterized protein n=1 Tax=uncultured Sulfurovum sp. TaxID=269237 RepID=A0A6S6S1W7_9BACT|nr:MAG: Unknown protein [uncultured Sulfurovum sp.]
MKRFMKFMSVVLVLGAVATASDLGGNPEVFVKKGNPTTVFGNCDPYMRALGLCRSSNDII